MTAAGECGRSNLTLHSRSDVDFYTLAKEFYDRPTEARNLFFTHADDASHASPAAGLAQRGYISEWSTDYCAQAASAQYVSQPHD